jgi:hypothetical protein
MTPHLDYAAECFHNSRIVQPAHWRENWEFAMWKHLFWAAEGGEI